MFIKSLLENPKNITYEGEDSDEKILYILRQSFILNIPWMVSVIALAFLPFFLYSSIPTFISSSFKLAGILFWYLLLFGYSFQRFLNWFFNVYIISNKKIIDVDFHGILYKNISEAPLRSIEDVTSTVSGVVGVTFNIGDVFIQTAAETSQFEFNSVDNPSKLRDLISDLVARKRGHN